MEFSLLSHILLLKLRIPFILCSTTDFQDLLTWTLPHTSPNPNSMGLIPTRKVFWSSCRFLVNHAMIPIVATVKSRVQFYIVRLVRYCPLWAFGNPIWFYFWFLFQKVSYWLELDISLYITYSLSNSPM